MVLGCWLLGGGWWKRKDTIFEMVADLLNGERRKAKRKKQK
jgi:hypothetical protein